MLYRYLFVPLKSICVQRNYKENRQFCYNYGCKVMFNL